MADVRPPARTRGRPSAVIPPKSTVPMRMPSSLEDLDHLPRDAEAHRRHLPARSRSAHAAPGRARCRRRPRAPARGRNTWKPASRQPLDAASEVKQIVLEHAARQARRDPGPCLLGRVAHASSDGRGERRVEPHRRRSPAGSPRRRSAHHGGDQRARVDLHQAVGRPRRSTRSRTRRRARVGALLEQHRRLSLVRRAAADAERARRRRRRTGRPSWSSGDARPESSWPSTTASSSLRRRRHERERLVQHAGVARRAPAPSATGRARRRRRPAGGPGAGAPRARRAAGVAHQELAAPDRSVVAEAEAVERDAEHRARRARARPCRRRRARGGAGRRPAGARAPRRAAWSRSRDAGRARPPRARCRTDARYRSQRVAVRGHRLLGVQVADVLGEEGARSPVARQNAAVQLGPDPEGRRPPRAARRSGAGASARARRQHRRPAPPRQTLTTESS